MTLELGGKSPNVFFEDVATDRDAFYDKALEGFTMFALNQGEVCTCRPGPWCSSRSTATGRRRGGSRRSGRATRSTPRRRWAPRPATTRLEKILSYLDIGRQEGAKVLTGGERNVLDGDLAEGYYAAPTVFEGDNSMHIFQEEIFGPVVSLTSFSTRPTRSRSPTTPSTASVPGWTRDGARAYRMGRGIKAGRVWTNCYHQYPAHAAFGGYKQSGIGRENHKMMLDHYQQTKNLLVSYSPDALGFF